jgi:hypothetical protein
MTKLQIKFILFWHKILSLLDEKKLKTYDFFKYSRNLP